MIPGSWEIYLVSPDNLFSKMQKMWELLGKWIGLILSQQNERDF